MALSKRLRYEILRRDNHTCRYCGASAPDVTLTVDHVVPVALGGLDDPSNLVAACRDCNAGKASSNPDATHVDHVADDALRWSAAMQQAANEAQAKIAERRDLHDRVDAAWWRGGRPEDWTNSIDNLVAAGLPEDMIIELVGVAQNKRGEVGYRWSYFCGCCWRRLKQLQGRAEEIVKGAAQPDATSTIATRWTPQDVHESLAYTANMLERDVESGLCAHGPDCMVETAGYERGWVNGYVCRDKEVQRGA